MSPGPYRILYIAKQFCGINGASRSAVDVLDALVANHHHVLVVSESRIDLKFRKNYSRFKVEWYCLGSRVVFPFQLRKFFFKRAAKWFLDKYHNFRLKQALQSCNLVVVNSLGSHAVFARLEDELCAKSVIIVRESPRHFGGEYQSRTLDSATEMLKQYDRHLFVSSNCRDDWARLEVVGNKKAFYVPNCCPEDAIQQMSDVNCGEIRESLGITASQFFVLCVGTIHHRKGQDLIVDQWKSLTHEIPNMVMCFAGSVPTVEGKALCKRIESELRDDRLKLLGHREDVLALIKAADAVVLPSRSEAMPRVILEAMVLKTAVVASDVDGIPELVEHSKSGLLFPLHEPEKLVELLSRIASDPGKRQSLANAAHVRYWERFSKQQQIERYGAVMTELLT